MASKQKDYQLIFCAYNGPGPYACAVCDGAVQPPWINAGARNRETLHVHHKDYDHENNNPENLQATHARCHCSLHKTGRRISPEHREVLIAGVRRYWAARPKKERVRMTEDSRRAALAARKLLSPEERKRRYERWGGLSIEQRSARGKAMRAGKSWKDAPQAISAFIAG